MKRTVKLLLTLSAVMITILLVSTVAYAAPAMNVAYTYVQPSKGTFEARLMGDEWFNFTAAITGDVIIKGQDDYWYYAVPDTIGIKASSARYIIDSKPEGSLTIDDMYDIGVVLYSKQNTPGMRGLLNILQSPELRYPDDTQKILVLLVSFDVDLDGFKDAGDTFIQHEDSIWSRTFFSTDGNGKTVANYYTEVSDGNLTFEPAEETYGIQSDGVVSVCLDYVHPNTGNSTDHRNQQIVAKALNAADAFVDFKAFDNDKNGYIDISELHIVTVVAGYERACGDCGSDPSVWAHRWTLDNAGDTPSAAAVRAPMLDGVTLCDWVNGGGYTQVGEINIAGATAHMATIGTICHELGHDIGLPDLYDPTTGSEGVGIHSLMGSGNWCYTDIPGDTPSHLDPWSKIQLGFVAPKNVFNSGSYRMNAAAGGSLYNVLRIQTGVPGEYFLVENRAFKGYDAGLDAFAQSGGIAIWHINEDVIAANFAAGAVNGNVNLKGVDLEEASYVDYDSLDPKSQLDDNNSKGKTYNNYFRPGAAGVLSDFTSVSNPSSNRHSASSTAATYIDIRVMSAPADSMQVAVSLSNDASLTGGSLAGRPFSGALAGGSTITSSTLLTVKVPDASMTNAILSLTTGNTAAIVKYVLSATQPANESDYTETYSAAGTSITVADGDVIWLRVAAPGEIAMRYYKITVTRPSAAATLSSGTLAGIGISGTFTGGTDITSSARLVVTIPYAARTSAALMLTKGDTNAAVRYFIGSQPDGDTGYENTYTAGSTGFTVTDSDVIWLLVTAEDGITKLYYKISVTVTPPPPSGGSGGGGGGGGSPSSKTPGEDVTATIFGKITTASVEVIAADTAGTTIAEVPDKSMEKLMNTAAAAESAGKDATIEINIIIPKDTKSVDINIPGALFGELTRSTDAVFIVKTGIGTLTFDAAAAEAVSAAAGTDNITMSIDIVAPSALSAETRRLVGDRPVYDFSVSAGGNLISSFGGNPVTVSVPYVRYAGEDPNAIVICLISDSGVPTIVPNCVYDETTGMITFMTDHFSQYAVSYQNVSFTDVSGRYTGDVHYLAARGIMTGVGDNAFMPEGTLTRAEFIAILTRVSGADLSRFKTSSFSDVKVTDWYFGAAEWAKDNNIANGCDGEFNPRDSLTRQDMAVMLVRYAAFIQYRLPESSENIVFPDGSKIAPYAIDAVTAVHRAGIMTGLPDGSFGPTANVTRAEAAKVIRDFLMGMFKDS